MNRFFKKVESGINGLLGLMGFAGIAVMTLGVFTRYVLVGAPDRCRKWQR